MSKNYVIKRIVLGFFIFIFYVVIFYFLLDKYLTFSVPGLSVNITILFALISLTGFIIALIFFFRDNIAEVNFLKEIKTFLDMLSKGRIEDNLSLKKYPHLTDLYSILKNVTYNLKIKFSQNEEERAKLNAIIQNIPEALIILDGKNNILFANERFTQLFGFSHPLNRSIFEVIRNPELIDLLEMVRSSKKTESGKIVLDFPQEKHFQARVSPFSKSGDILGTVILLQDVTELKKLETMRKDFVANVSHEIKTPVTAIKGFAETLLDGAIEDRENALRFLSTIKSHSERLNRLVDDLMTISRIELGVIKINKTNTDLSEIIDSVIDTLNSKASAKRLYLKKVLFSENTSINADRDRTMQILLNLIDNSIKFTETGGIEIGIKSEDGSEYFFVKDTGVGIPQKYISRLGERFFRVDPSRSRELGGTGLGLAIVKHLVKAHEWDMKIDSEVNMGTVVKIFIQSIHSRVD